MSTKAKKQAEQLAPGPKGHGHRYTAEFRREALRMMDNGKSQSQVSVELGVSVGTLQQWRLKARVGTARGVEPGAVGASVTAENERLKRELRSLRMDLDIAKKLRPSSRVMAREILLHCCGEGQLPSRATLPAAEG